jgi:hypothetical protein
MPDLACNHGTQAYNKRCSRQKTAQESSLIIGTLDKAGHRMHPHTQGKIGSNDSPDQGSGSALMRDRGDGVEGGNTRLYTRLWSG